MKYFAASKLSENIVKTHEGFLLCIGVSIARVGEMQYAKGETPIAPGEDGLTIIDRVEEEVFSTRAMGSFEGKPFTVEHPEDFVNPKNAKELVAGHVQNIRRGIGDSIGDLLADIMIMDADAISLVNSGMREISCGYECNFVETDKGRGKQVDIVGNHVALVKEGRAGPEYAIKDQKGAFKMAKTWSDKFKKIFDKVADEAAAEMEKEHGEQPAKDEAPMYDELVKICKDLGEKIDAMKPKAADAEDPPAPKEDKPMEDADVESSMEERMKALEMAVAKLIKGEESEESDVTTEDEDVDVEQPAKDEADPSMMGDSARAEILAPGILKTGKDLKVRAIQTAYKTADGKKVIDSLTGGKMPKLTIDSQVDLLFTAASEMMKEKRIGDLAKTRQAKVVDSLSDVTTSSVITPEKMNELNAKYWALKK